MHKMIKIVLLVMQISRKLIILMHPKAKIDMRDVLQAESNDTIVLMTCAGQDLGNKDATHRLIITAKYLKSS